MEDDMAAEEPEPEETYEKPEPEPELEPEPEPELQISPPSPPSSPPHVTTHANPHHSSTPQDVCDRLLRVQGSAHTPSSAGQAFEQKVISHQRMASFPIE